MWVIELINIILTKSYYTLLHHNYRYQVKYKKRETEDKPEADTDLALAKQSFHIIFPITHGKVCVQ